MNQVASDGVLEPRRDAVITATGLTKQYGAVTAVAGIDFEVCRGECFGFLGPNGAGKTTTMKMIYRAASVGGGSLRILGQEVSSGDNDRQIKRYLGVVPQHDDLDVNLTVRENLETFARFYRLDRARARQVVSGLLESFGLGDKAEVRANRLSGGLKRRVQIARGLLGDPEILILDEPTTALDPQARQYLWQRLVELKRKQKTLLLTTHYLDEAERLCDRLVIIDGGNIVARGSPRSLIAEHVPPHVIEIDLDATRSAEVVDDALRARAARVEVLPDRTLLYTNQGEELLERLARQLPDHRTLMRRSNLEDVFLKITGRELNE